MCTQAWNSKAAAGEGFIGGPLSNRSDTVQTGWRPELGGGSVLNATNAMWLHQTLPPLSLTITKVRQAQLACRSYVNTTTNATLSCGLRATCPSGGVPPCRQNVTLYRITPRNVTDLGNKNTGDPLGVFSRPQSQP